jgi:hypothetical protein
MTKSGSIWRNSFALPASYHSAKLSSEQAVALRQERRMSRGAVGTALVHGATLVTRNVDNFQWIQGLSIHLM